MSKESPQYDTLNNLITLLQKSPLFYGSVFLFIVFVILYFFKVLLFKAKQFFLYQEPSIYEQMEMYYEVGKSGEDLKYILKKIDESPTIPWYEKVELKMLMIRKNLPEELEEGHI